jgi:hypothetical protein
MPLSRWVYESMNGELWIVVEVEMEVDPTTTMCCRLSTVGCVPHYDVTTVCPSGPTRVARGTLNYRWIDFAFSPRHRQLLHFQAHKVQDPALSYTVYLHCLCPFDAAADPIPLDFARSAFFVAVTDLFSPAAPDAPAAWLLIGATLVELFIPAAPAGSAAGFTRADAVAFSLPLLEAVV